MTRQGHNAERTIIAAFILVSTLAVVQESAAQDGSDNLGLHSGFYFSLSGGMAFGAITLNATNTTFSKFEANGTGFQYDAKAGYVISDEEQLILSIDAIRRAVSSPTFTLDGASVYSPSSVSANDAMYGIGVTKYFMPANMFVSGTFGVGRFQIDYANVRVTSHNGFAFQLKGGQEWWLDDNWGAGISVGISHIAADDQADPARPGYSGKLSTLKAFFLVSITYY